MAQRPGRIAARFPRRSQPVTRRSAEALRICRREHREGELAVIKTPTLHLANCHAHYRF
jgi:hypothetical protein